MNTLITAASDSAAYRLARLLSNRDIYFGSNIQLSSFNNLKYLLIPSTDSPSYSHELLKICLDNSINEIFPLKEKELLELSSTQILFEEFEIKIRIPNRKLFNSKLLKYRKDLPYLSVFSDGELIAGDAFQDIKIAKELENGVYRWGVENAEINIELFFI